MGIARTYAVHAIDDSTDPAADQADVRREFDYAALVKRARTGSQAQARRPPDRLRPGDTGAQAARSNRGHAHEAPSPAESARGDDLGGFDEDEAFGNAGRSSNHKESSSSALDRIAAAPDPGASNESLAEQLRRHGTPYLDALSLEQHAVFVLVDYLGARVADFCSDPAVLAQGHWTMRLPLDPAILPDCTLSLTLSYFDLTLRFDTQDASSKQIVLHHGDVLKHRLEALLMRHDAPRTVEIVVE